jgi:hypothetical protein
MSAWFYARQGQTVGPLSWDQLRALAQRGALRPEDHVFEQSLGKWVPAATVTGLTAPAAPAPRAAPAAVKPVVKSAPLPALAPHPAAAAPASPRWSQGLLALPKPLLFGLCGALGGLLAALCFGELLWAALRPAEAAPHIHLALPATMRIYAGGQNQFALKIARQAYAGPVSVEVAGMPPGVRAAPQTIAAGDTEAEVVIHADEPVPVGKHRLTIRVHGADKAVAADAGTLELDVEAPPPSLRLAVSPQVSLQQGGEGRFGIKLARAHFSGPITLAFKDVPVEVALRSVTVPAHQSEVEVRVSAQRGAAAGAHTVTVAAVGGSAHARETFSLEVLSAPVPKVDVLFVLDLTNSMQFAINGVKDGIGAFAERLEAQRVDARIGLVAFRDIVDDRELPYVLRFNGATFTTDYQAFRSQVQRLTARGGGDTPESSLQALGLAAKQPFRPDASRVLVLITDAPPKVHANIPPVTPADAAALLREHGISQIHLVVHREDYEGDYRVLHERPFKGSFFDINRVQGGDAFAGLLPKLSEAISRITVASLPAPPAAAAPPPLPTAFTQALPPASAPTLKAVQSTQAFAAEDRSRLIVAIAIWTAAIAAGISLLILGGQHYYLRQTWLTPIAAAQALIGGLLAGLVGGAVGQLFYQSTSGGTAWDVLSRIVGWGLLGGVLGGGLALFVPNLKWSRGLLGGLAGGLLGAIAFLLLSLVVGSLLGRWIGAAVLGFCIGFMVALAELAFRRWWLEVAFSAREVRTVTLGSAEVSVGGDERLASVFVQGAPAVALRYRLEAGRVLCEDVAAGRTVTVESGDSRRLGSVTVKVCSPASARQSGYRLVLTGGKAVSLGEGMPLTADDLPGLQPQAADGIVALVSRRPSDPLVLLLRNRSRQAWLVYKADGTQHSIGPGLGVELGADLTIDFGGAQGRVTRTDEVAV